MQIFYGFTISEYIGLIVGSIALVVLLVYYGISAIIRAWKSRRTQRALDAAFCACKGDWFQIDNPAKCGNCGKTRRQ